MHSNAILVSIDAMRHARRLLGVTELLALADRGIMVLDPMSTLIGCDVVIGRDTTIEPNVQLLCSHGGAVSIGDGNMLHAGTRIEATGGHVRIGRDNVFGPGGFLAMATTPYDQIDIGDGGRYALNCSFTGRTFLGSGSQVLGPIAVHACHLEAGGSHREPDPDARGAVLKGTGRARGLTVARGHVIQAFGLFDMADVRMQSHFHPPGLS